MQSLISCLHAMVMCTKIYTLTHLDEESLESVKKGHQLKICSDYYQKDAGLCLLF